MAILAFVLAIAISLLVGIGLAREHTITPWLSTALDTVRAPKGEEGWYSFSTRLSPACCVVGWKNDSYRDALVSRFGRRRANVDGTVEVQLGFPWMAHSYLLVHREDINRFEVVSGIPSEDRSWALPLTVVLPGAVGNFCIYWASAFGLLWIVAKALRKWRKSQGQCPCCGYWLRAGLPRCSECGYDALAGPQPQA